ncbi:TolC family protein [candidate division KSB1 bacterium]|nr:TolC family protein [candidate division KSB1 bacterium]
MIGKRILFILLTWISLGFAQSLTLEECIDVALKNNSTLRNAERQVEAAGTQVTDAWSALLPTVSSSFSAGKYIQGARVVKGDVPVGIDPTTGRTLYEQQEIVQGRIERNSHSASISLSQNIWDFGRSSNGIRQSRAMRDAARYSKEQTELQVILQVKEAYYQLLKTLRLNAVYEKAVALAQQQVEEAQTRLEIGLASQAEVYEAKVNLGTNRAAYLEQVNLVEFARADLNFAMGRDPGLPIEVSEDSSEPIFPELSIEQAVQTAIDNNKTIKRLEFDARSTLFAFQAAKARYMPTLGFGASYRRSNDDYSRVYTDKLDQDYSVNMGVSLDLNLFNGFSDKAAVQRQQLNHQISQENLIEAKRVVTADVKQYFLRLSAYQDLLQINRENIVAAEENLRLQQEKRRIGSGTELEVTQAQVRLIESQSNYVRAEYDAKIARARLETAMGLNNL